MLFLRLRLGNHLLRCNMWCWHNLAFDHALAGPAQAVSEVHGDDCNLLFWAE